ncbi:hypothetical protein HXX76_000990 [Chlamydomonas incerta]|uniref:Uncharacterized protein n=1 Tax=Chlamydomonas incerta TaxID=51695 RepID=A0A836B394_CHLIN|nr:hypothetical protein HXX76_000990 [Chlamydomonas incerta]|eukprot:KAG2446405.1 hypothetical protein HXX76_000990 [Chlamydomonas incerta]
MQQPPGRSGTGMRAGGAAGGFSANFDDLAPGGGMGGGMGSAGSPRALDSSGRSAAGASDAAAVECGPVELAEAAAVVVRPAQVLRLLQASELTDAARDAAALLRRHRSAGLMAALQGLLGHAVEERPRQLAVALSTEVVAAGAVTQLVEALRQGADDSRGAPLDWRALLLDGPGGAGEDRQDSGGGSGSAGDTPQPPALTRDSRALALDVLLLVLASLAPPGLGAVTGPGVSSAPAAAHPSSVALGHGSGLLSSPLPSLTAPSGITKAAGTGAAAPGLPRQPLLETPSTAPLASPQLLAARLTRLMQLPSEQPFRAGDASFSAPWTPGLAGGTRDSVAAVASDATAGVDSTGLFRLTHDPHEAAGAGAGAPAVSGPFAAQGGHVAAAALAEDSDTALEAAAAATFAAEADTPGGAAGVMSALEVAVLSTPGAWRGLLAGAGDMLTPPSAPPPPLWLTCDAASADGEPTATQLRRRRRTAEAESAAAAELGGAGMALVVELVARLPPSESAATDGGAGSGSTGGGGISVAAPPPWLTGVAKQLARRVAARVAAASPAEAAGEGSEDLAHASAACLDRVPPMPSPASMRQLPATATAPAGRPHRRPQRPQPRWLAAVAEQRTEAAAAEAEAEVLWQSGASPAGGLRSSSAAAQAARVVAVLVAAVPALARGRLCLRALLAVLSTLAALMAALAREAARRQSEQAAAASAAAAPQRRSAHAAGYSVLLSAAAGGAGSPSSSGGAASPAPAAAADPAAASRLARLRNALLGACIANPGPTTPLAGALALLLEVAAALAARLPEAAAAMAATASSSAAASHPAPARAPAAGSAAGPAPAAAGGAVVAAAMAVLRAGAGMSQPGPTEAPAVGDTLSPAVRPVLMGPAGCGSGSAGAAVGDVSGDSCNVPLPLIAAAAALAAALVPHLPPASPLLRQLLLTAAALAVRASAAGGAPLPSAVLVALSRCLERPELRGSGWPEGVSLDGLMDSLGTALAAAVAHADTTAAAAVAGAAAAAGGEPASPVAAGNTGGSMASAAVRPGAAAAAAATAAATADLELQDLAGVSAQLLGLASSNPVQSRW